MDAVDIDTIDDEDVLKQMWQVTEDFAEKRRIRARMYKLREKRLKDFYTSDDVMTAGSPSAASLPSQSATSSYNYSTSSATTETITTSSSLSAMETDEADGVNGQSRQVDQKRRNDANQEEDAVSEKIRRKSSVRTKRYQMILAASGGTQESSQTSTTSSSSSSRMETSERAMSPDSLSGSQLIMADGPGQKSLNIRPEESNVSVSSDSSYQELKSSSRRREFQEGDILTIQQVTETWRRIRESGQSAAVTQRVTLTKTTRQRVSDGAVLEENEDEVIDDIDDDNRGDFSGSDGITAVDAALRRSSIIAITSTDGAEENVSVSKKKFETGDVVIDDALSEPDSLDNLENNLPEPDGVDNHSQADSLEMTQTTFTSMTTQHHQSNSLFADSDVSNHSAAEAAATAAIAAANIEEQVEQLIVPTTESKPVARSSSNSATRSKRTPSESPSRGATSASPANKKRADSAELRKSTAASSSSGSGSRTGLGGINRSASGSSTSAGNTTKSSSKTTATVTASLKGSSSSIPRLTSTPISAQKGKKTGATASEVAVQDDSVTEFLQLEKEIQGEKVVNEEAKTTAVKRPVNTSGTHRPTTPVTSRKAAAEPRSTATSSPRVQPSSSFSSADKKVATKKAETTTTSVSRSSSSAASVSAMARRELASPSSSKPTTVLGRPAMIRTVETTRTITVRDRDEDKPWRMNSSSSSSTRSNKGVSGIGRPARKDLHNNVMSVVEKYVDSEGCALHGSHPHIHDDVEDVEDVGHGHSPSPPPSTATGAASATPTQTATATPVDEKPVQKAKTSDEGEENEPVAPQTNGVAEEDGPAPAVEEEPCTEQVVAQSARREENMERPKKLSVITTGSMAPTDGGAESATSPSNKSGSRLSVASPVLGSPSVVKKARSLFRSDSMEGPSVESAKAEAAPPPAVPTGGTANISKIRSSFENATTTATSTIKRENTKLWEPAANNPRIHKLEPRPPSVVAVVRDGQPDSWKSPVPSRSSSAGLFTKSRSPSPIKDVVAVATVAPPGRQTTPTPQESAAPVVDDVTAVGGSSSSTGTGEGQVIEDIEDLTLLENMLNTATNYDDRSRIRAHMRIVKKKLGLAVSSPMPTRKAAAPAPKTSFSEPAANRNKLADVKRKPSESAAEAKNEPVHQVRTPAAVEPVPVEPVSAEPVSAEPVPAERAAAELAVTVQRDEVAVVEEMQMSSVSTTSMMMTTMTSETSESSSRKSSMTQQEQTQQTKVRKISQPYDCRSETKEFVPRVAEEQPTVTVAGQVNGDGGATPVSSSDQEGSSETSSPRMSRAPWRRQSSEANMVKTPTHLPEPESNPETLDITSSYGTGPMDENGRPLFGLGALRRRPTKPLNITGADEGQQSPQPIIIERSQTLTELQKLHESQTVQSKGELEPVEKPRAKLRDTFTNWTDTEADGDRAEPIISERSQALREIIRIHEQQVSSAEATTVEAPPPSPTRPKAKLKDSFVAPSPDCADEPDPSSSAIEQMIERSESFQTIVKRHQELSTSQTPTGPQASPPMKRPGILKKPKDWSSPSPQEVPSPVKDDQAMTSTSSSCSLLTSSSRKTSVEVSSATTLDFGGARKASVESSIEIQLNPVQSSSIVVTEIPAPALMERRSSGAAPTYSTVQYNSVQDVKMDNRRGSTHQQYQQQQPRKFSIEVEPSPTMHTSSVTLSTASKAPAPAPMSSRAVPAVASAPFVLSGETAGHSVRSTSTFQLSTSGRNSSVVTAPIMAASVAAVAAPVPTGDDPTPWRRKSIPREPSIPRDAAAVTSTATFIPAPAPAPAPAPVPVQVAEIPLAQPHQSVPTRVSTAKMSMQETLPPAAVPAPVSTFVSSSPLTVRSNRISSSSVSGTETSNFQRHGSINQRYRPSQPENNAPYGSGGVKPSPEPRVKTLAATGASVRALAQKFLVTGEEKSQAQVSKSSAYPKAGLIYRSNSFRSQNNADGAGGSIGLVRSESLRISPARSRVSMDRQSQERNVDEPFSALSMTRRESNTLMSSSERRTSSSYNQSTSSLVVNGGHDEPLMVATPADSLASSATFTTTATTSKSFLQDRTPVRGMQDIIGRMRATDAGSAVGSSEDERSLSLLNKLIGAQILVQCTEQAATSAGVAGGQPSRPEASLQSFSSCTEQRSADGTRLSRTSTQQRTGSSFESGQDEDSGASWTRRSSSTAKFQTTSTVHQPQQFNITATISDDHIGNGAGGIGIGTGMAQTSIPGVAAAAAAGSRAGCVIDGIDINTCTDDFKLNELLDNCNDYETRRQIRARIKTLLSDVKGPADVIQRSSNNNAFGSSTVQSKTEVTMTRQSNFTRSGQPGQSAFSKFQQLDQSVKSSTR
uniref:Smoothelin domain-containing protein n=1 Tax=Daphnia magna TaxID=35525 RepID=A0A0N8DXB2_9CRUS